MGVHVRPATEAEYPAVGDICVAAYRADGQLPPTPPPVGEHDYTVALADVSARARIAEILVAVDDASGAILGSVTFARFGSRFAEVAREGEGEFRMLAVAPEAQGRGLGKMLVRACMEHGIELGLTALAICVRDSNVVARRMYEKFGFTRIPERDWAPAPHVRLEALHLPL